MSGFCQRDIGETCDINLNKKRKLYITEEVLYIEVSSSTN